MHDADDSTFTGILLYDGDCPFCSAASTAMRQLDDVGVVPWSDPSAQAFLEAQFDGTPFALFFVDIDAESVWAGRAAASELCNRAGMPVLVQDIVDESYERIADAIQFVSGLDREIDPYHDEYPLTDAAAVAFDDLTANARRTHLPSGADRPSDVDRLSDVDRPSDEDQPADEDRSSDVDCPQDDN